MDNTIISAKDFKKGKLYGSSRVNLDGEIILQDQFLNDFETEGTEMLSIKIFEDKGFNTQLTENLDLIINDSSNIDSILEAKKELENFQGIFFFL